MSESNDLKDRTVTIEKTLNAPIKLVWEAWTQPEHIIQWWGPKGMDTKVIAHDFTVGGQWKYTMLMPDGNEFVTDGVYTEIVALERICSTANFKPMTEGIEIQALFAADGAQTKFTFNIIHPTVAYCKQQTAMGILNGWGSVFERLEAFVNTLNN
jgi:uncharacterized protein YndB with AHSA1/START domain